jgi:hypothetical protein
LFIDLVFWDLQEKMGPQSKIVDKGLFTKGENDQLSITKFNVQGFANLILFNNYENRELTHSFLPHRNIGVHSFSFLKDLKLCFLCDYVVLKWIFFWLRRDLGTNESSHAREIIDTEFHRGGTEFLLAGLQGNSYKGAKAQRNLRVSATFFCGNQREIL